MNLSLEQLRTLEAVSRLGSVSAAASELRRVPSAILYQMRQLEDAIGAEVFDRSGYRTTLSSLGKRLLEESRALLDEVERVARFCETLRLGYEPTLTVVFDGLLPVQPLLAAVRAVADASPETRVSLFSEYLGGVEERAHLVDADLALSLVPFSTPIGPTSAMDAVVSRLVVSATHPLATREADADTLAALGRHTLLTVRGSDPRLGLLPSGFSPAAELHLSDFAAKKEALLAGMGWGWMPHHLIVDELARGRLVQLHTPPGPGPHTDTLQSEHVFTPMLHLRRVGRAAEAFLLKLGVPGGAAPR